MRVIAPPDVGGGFGTKGMYYPEYIVVAELARQLGRPVKWIETRREHTLVACVERDQVHDVEIAATRDGRLLGAARRLPPRDGRLHDLRPQPAAERDDPLGGLLRDPDARPALPRGDDQHHAGGRLPRRRAPVRHRASSSGRWTRSRGELAHGPGRAAPAQPDPRRPASVRHRPHHRGARAGGLRQRRLPALHGPGAGGARPARGADASRRGCAREGRYLGIGVVNYVEATATVPNESAVVRVQPGRRASPWSAAPRRRGRGTSRCSRAWSAGSSGWIPTRSRC